MSAAGTGTPDAPELVRLRRQLSHDIHHELSTIMLLASMLSSAPDVGADSRNRARHILEETRWLDQLHRAYYGNLGAAGRVQLTADPIRLDLLAAEVVGVSPFSTYVEISFSATPSRV